MIARRLARQPHRVDGVFIIGHIDQRAAAPRQQDAAIVLHHLRQPGNKDFIVRPEQALRAQNGKTGVRVGLRQQVDHLFAGCLAAGKLVGEAVRAEIFLNIAMVVIIKIERGRRDMNEIAYAPCYRPLAEATGGADVSEIESLLRAPGRGKA